MDEDVEISRGKSAHQLLENPLLKEALDAIEQSFRDEIENSNLSQRDLREEAFRMLCAAKVFRKHLTRYIETGKMASMSKAQRHEQKQREQRLMEWDGSPDGRTRLEHP